MRYFKRCKKLFTKHPEAVGETYIEHFIYASGAAKRTAKISLIMMLHAACPFACEHTASEELNKLNKEMQKRRESSHER